MVTTLLTAFTLGLFAGLAPGPYTTMVVGTALEKGFRPALRLAFTPLVTDVAPVVVTALVLERLSWPALTLLGLAGGVVIAMIGARFLTRHGGSVPPTEASEAAGEIDDQSARFGHVVLSSILSPAPWLFWLVVGSPLLLRAWERSPGQGVLFLVILFATNVGSATSLAWAASHGSRLLGPGPRRWVLRFVGVGLIGAGGFLVWQSMSGDFQGWVDSQHTVRSVVDPQAPDPPPDGTP